MDPTPSWPDDSGLIIDRGAYVLNWMRANAFNLRCSLAKLGKPVDRDEWWLTPLGSPDIPHPWAIHPPEDITDIQQIAVAVPKRILDYPFRLAREIPLGIWVTIHSQRQLHADGRRFRKMFAPSPVWVEFDLEKKIATWYHSEISLPLAGIKESMEFVRR